MKHRIVGILLAGALVCSVMGCGVVSQPAGTSESSSASSVTGTSEHVETPTKTPSEGPSVSGESVLASPTPEEEGKKIEITIPYQEGMQSTYSTMEGLTLEGGSHIAVVAKDLASGYWKAVKKGAELAIADLNGQLGYTGEDKIRLSFEGPDNESDIEAQINTIDSVIQENPAALCLGIIDMKSCQAQLESAKDSEIPIIIADSGIQSDLIDATCASDNYAAAKAAAEKLSQAIGDSGEVIIVAHQYNTETSIQRVKGFQDEIQANHPNVSVVQINYGDGEESVSGMLKNTLTAHPNVKGIFCTNEIMGEETLAALKEREDAENIKVVGFDSGEAQLEAIREGREEGVITQNPYGLGYAMVVAAVRAASELPVDSFVNTGYQWLDQTNLDLEENQKYLYN